jgi:hypothetical protein
VAGAAAAKVAKTKAMRILTSIFFCQWCCCFLLIWSTEDWDLFEIRWVNHSYFIPSEVCTTICEELKLLGRPPAEVPWSQIATPCTHWHNNTQRLTGYTVTLEELPVISWKLPVVPVDSRVDVHREIDEATVEKPQWYQWYPSLR